jgi:hypothetical protein
MLLVEDDGQPILRLRRLLQGFDALRPREPLLIRHRRKL